MDAVAKQNNGVTNTSTLVKDFLRPYYRRLRNTKLYQKPNMARLYLSTQLATLQAKQVFQDIKTYAMFVGHGMSGHSIIGTLLDAHPNIIFPDEVDVLKYIAAGFRKNQVFHLLLAMSRAQAKAGNTKQGRKGKLYSYSVPGQWQGRFEKLQVIGDTKAGVSTKRLGEDPTLLQRLRDTIDADIKFIHVVRNPYDNISTMCLKPGRLELQPRIDRYFFFCEILRELRTQIEDKDLLLLRQEDFIAQPADTLRVMCRFLGVQASDNYLNACAGIVYKSPVKSRYELQWDDESIKKVKAEIERFDFLEDYSYAN